MKFYYSDGKEYEKEKVKRYLYNCSLQKQWGRLKLSEINSLLNDLTLFIFNNRKHKLSLLLIDFETFCEHLKLIFHVFDLNSKSYQDLEYKLDYKNQNLKEFYKTYVKLIESKKREELYKNEIKISLELSQINNDIININNFLVLNDIGWYD